MVFAKNIICFFRHVLQSRVKNAILSMIYRSYVINGKHPPPFSFYRVFEVLCPWSDLYPFLILPHFYFTKHKCFAFMGCHNWETIYTLFRFYRIFILPNINASHLWGTITGKRSIPFFDSTAFLFYQT